MGGSESKEGSKRDGDPGDDLGIDCENRTAIVSGCVVAAGLALLGVAVAGGVALASRGSDDRKTMKAPGRPGHRIVRDDFVDDPARYFSDLRMNRGSDDRKTMKAPGRSDDRIYRDDFEENPAQYFRDLRKKGQVDAGGVALAGKGSDDNRKTMRAPGRSDECIYRDEFEGEPAGYFRDLQKKGLVVTEGVAFADRGLDDRKTMKAPGQDHRIYREEFEGNPTGYFRNLRKKQLVSSLQVHLVGEGGGGGGEERKTMKAPGQDHRIYRGEFEGNPAGYFRDLRKKQLHLVEEEEEEEEEGGGGGGGGW